MSLLCPFKNNHRRFLLACWQTDSSKRSNSLTNNSQPEFENNEVPSSSAVADGRVSESTCEVHVQYLKPPLLFITTVLVGSLVNEIRKCKPFFILFLFALQLEIKNICTVILVQTLVPV